MPNKFTLLVVILFGAIVNWISYQFAKDYAGPLTATSVILLCTLVLKSKSESWYDYGLVKIKKPLRLLWQLPLIMVVTIITGVIANKLFTSFIEAEVVSQSRFEGMAGNLPMFLMWTLIGWVVGGFFEEMIFRGFLLGNIEKIIWSF